MSSPPLLHECRRLIEESIERGRAEGLAGDELRRYCLDDFPEAWDAPEASLWFSEVRRRFKKTVNPGSRLARTRPLLRIMEGGEA